MTLNLTIPQQLHSDFTPRIAVIGVGGGGTNAVDNMIALNLQGVDFVVANTDAQQLMHSRADRRVQLGPHLTQGLGAGAKPEIGRAAAEEAEDEMARHLDGMHMVFITAGMGGGTGTGAAPVIARMAKNRGVLTVGVVTKPFTFEGPRRARAAEEGILALQEWVDTLIVIPNQNLFRLATDRTGFKEAFKMADHVLYMGVRGVTDLMMAPGLVNLDFADVKTVMAEMGKAMMGTGEAEGENRAIRAAEAAISNPLLEDTNMSGARGLLINISGGDDMTLYEVEQAATRIREEVADDANIIFGSAMDESLNGRVRVSVVATGIDTPVPQAERPRLVAVGGSMMQEAPAQPGAGQGNAGQALTHPSGIQVGTGQPGNTQPGNTQPGNMQPGNMQPGAALQQPSGQAAEARQSDMQVQLPLAPQQQGHTGMGIPLTAPSPGQMRPAPVLESQHAPMGQLVETVVPLPGQPMQQQPSGQQRTTLISPRPGGLFANQPTRAPAPAAQAASPPQRRSIFQTVTGAMRRAPAAPAQPTRAEPAAPTQPSVTHAVPDEATLDIPAFLRRQTS